MVAIKVRLDNDDHYVGGNNIQYIVIHDTGNNTDSDEGNANYFCTGSRGASAHYFVDNDSITQIVKDTDCAWHCGDGNGRYGITNRNSIGIELCRVANKVEYQTKVNAVELVRMLMKKYNVPIDRVVRHYDASRKCCPSSMSANNWAEWYEFKKMITGQVSISNSNQPVASDTIYRIRNANNDVKSQIGAYRNLDTAKKLANEKGLCVWNGNNLVYNSQGTPSQPAVSSNGRQWTYQYDSQILELQKILNTRGFGLAEDGKMGESTYKAICNYTIDYGDKGEICKWIQKRLNSMGFNCGNPDGIIGTNTVNAIHSWQRANGLGEGTMYGSDFYYFCKSPVSGSQASTTTNSSNVNLHLRDLQGAYNADYGKSILVDGIRGKQTEQMLNEICLKVGDGHKNVISWLQCRVGTSIDGIFGNNTKNAVMNFQRQHGLIVDGIAGKNTFNKLLEIYK